MAMCPLLRKERIREQGAWWKWLEWKDENKKEGRCEVTFLDMVLTSIGNVNRALRQ
jgi:hypothetical protein